MAMDIAKNGRQAAVTALILAAIALLAATNLGHNQIYQSGVGFGETLRSADDAEGDGPMDLSDLDYELQQLGEQFGDSPLAGIIGDEDFTEGATWGYYKREHLGQ